MTKSFHTNIKVMKVRSVTFCDPFKLICLTTLTRVQSGKHSMMLIIVDRWLIFEDLLYKRVAEGVASDPPDFN